MKLDRLPAEMLAGTRTAHLPRQRTGSRPKLTLVFGREEDLPDHYRVGVAVCSDEDQFSKAMGQKKAYYRMRHSPLMVGEPGTLYDALCAYLKALDDRRENIDTGVFTDVYDACEELDQFFGQPEGSSQGS